MAKVIVMIMDSFGIGHTPDAVRFGDTGANTFYSIAKWRAEKGEALNLPNLSKLGLVEAAKEVSGVYPPLVKIFPPENSYYCASIEKSFGKDTPSGHWELMGCPVEHEWGFFNQKFTDPRIGESVFPPDLMHQWLDECGFAGSYGNCHASGTEIIVKYGEEHIKTGMPICYTSADSVFQIAAHETTFGLEKLYHACKSAKKIFDKINIARVIARPFIGEPGNFTRTGNRHDYTTPPPADTLLDVLVKNNHHVIAIGKISDIFAARGISQAIKADGLENLCEATINAYKNTPDGSLIFTNLVDFDSIYGHRRDVEGYAKAVEFYDNWLPKLINQLDEKDYLVISADHGCDPTWSGTDHTREHVPILMYSKSYTNSINCGVRDSFADLGQSLAKIFNVGKLNFGKSFV